MKTYTVTVAEVVDSIYEVQAKSKKEARQKAKDYHVNGMGPMFVNPLDTVVLERAVCAVKAEEA
jgi:hypothetical protein